MVSSKYSSDLSSYLKKFSIKDKNYNVLSMGSPKGKYRFVNIENLFNVIHDAINKDNFNPHLTQKPDEISCITIDIDLRQPIDNMNRLYTDELFVKLANMCFKHIKDNLNVKDAQKLMYVFEKKNLSNNKGKMKDGIHIMFPFIHIDSMYKKSLYLNLKTSMDIFFKDLGYDNYDDVFDFSTISTNCWLIYGCCKPGCEPYKLTQVYDQHGMAKDVPVDIRQIMKDCSVFKNDTYVCKYKSGRFDILSSECKTLDSKKVKSVVDESINKVMVNKKIIKYILKKPQNECSLKKIQYAKNLALNCLSEEYSDAYDKWFNVGITLHNISHTLKDAWHEFSKKSLKYDKNICDGLWEKFDYLDAPNKLTMGSLIYWARKCNKKEYAEATTVYSSYSIDKMQTQTNNAVAEAFCDIYGNLFVCGDIKNDRWFRYDTHRWVEDIKGVTVRKMISKEFAQEIMNIAIDYNKKAADGECSEDDRVKYLNKSKIYNEIVIKLKQTSYKSNVMKEISEFLYQPSFIEELDKNKNLMGFKNGVFDFDEYEFRDGIPSDNISMSTNVDYIPYSEINNNQYFSDVVDEVYEVIESIHPDTIMRNYLLNLLASVNHGLIKEQKFHIWTGTGSNGKSILIDLIKNSLGDYAVVLPTSMITSKRGSSTSANPELVKTKGVRFCVLQEPEENAQINTGVMKELCAGDEQTARGLFSNPIRFHPQFTIVMTCNHLPNIPSNDGGTWRRINVIEFKSKFKSNPDDENINEKKADTGLLVKIDSQVFKEAYLSIIVEQYKQYSKCGIKEPEEVIKYTMDYQQRSDFYEQFINDHIVKTDDKKDIIKITEIYQCFSKWFKFEFNGQKIPKKMDLKMQLRDKLSNMFSTGWKYYKLKEDEEDDEESDEEEKKN